MSGEAPHESAPLDGIVVLDLTRIVAGPYCTRLLGDLGARVIKVEPPTADIARGMGPRINGISGVFAQHNLGKECVCVDLERPGSIDFLLELVRKVDVLVDNFRPGVMERMGMGAEALRQRNPRLIHCMISGFGAASPARDKRAFAGVIHAMTGLVHSQTQADQRAPTDQAHAQACSPVVVSARACA